MRKMYIIAALMLPLALGATQRVMVMEDFTATWCTYCPGAARGAEELKFRAFDSVVVIAYHSSSSDPFYTTTAATRMSYYSVSGYPTMIFDGSNRIVGGLHYGTMYPAYRQVFDSRKSVPSPLDIHLDVTYDSVSRSGTLTIVVRNVSGSSVSGQLHTVLIESHIYYPWQGMDSLHDVERTMLPNAGGEAITIPAGDSVVRTREFTISSNWVAKNCELVVFVQNNSTREIYQGAMTAVIPTPALEFVGYQPVLPMPGGSFELVVGLRNIGSAPAIGVEAVLSSDDQYLTIVSASTTFDTILIGEDVYASAPFVIRVDSSCPSPHLATMVMVISSVDMSDTITFPLKITIRPGFCDNMERGENGWTHGGIRDYWHLSDYRSISPAKSWYCGNEGGHQYINEQDARLITPFFTLGESTYVRFWHYYETEANYDFCLVEVNNGSPFWRPLVSFTGSSGGWEQVDLDLSEFQGQTVQLRFRFVSDYNVVAEGWYIDDFAAGIPVGTSENRTPAVETHHPLATIVRSRLILPPQTGSSSLCAGVLLDVSGRKKRDLYPGVNDITSLAPGVYFLRGNEGGLKRVVVVH
ncbi:MAG: Omp28-related outer membrane protein [candidate division WOR-3 bacterium]